MADEPLSIAPNPDVIEPLFNAPTTVVTLDSVSTCRFKIRFASLTTSQSDALVSPP